MQKSANALRQTAERERGLTDVRSGQRERRVRGRDPFAAHAAQPTPREEENEHNGDRNHQRSMLPLDDKGGGSC